MGKIVVNSNTLRNYAERISALNKKISNLDSRLKKLFIQSGIVDLAMLIKEETLLKQSARLSNCQNYLLRTASRFDGVEKTVSSSNLKKSTLVGAGKGGAWAGVAFLSQIAVYSDKLKSGLNVGNDVFFRSAVIKNGITGYINILESIKSPKDKLESAISWMNNMRKSISKDDNYVKHISELDQSLLNAVAAAVNYRKVNTTVESLKELLNQCEITYKKKIEELAADDGRTLVLFGALISNAIHSLSQSSDTVETPDQIDASIIGAAAWSVSTTDADDSNDRSDKTGISREQKYYLGQIELMTDGKEHSRLGSECKGYANWMYYQLFGVDLGAYKENRMWEINSSTATQVGSISKADSNLDFDSLSDLMGKSQPGDEIQLVWKLKNGGTSQHSMIFKNFEYDSEGKIIGLYTLEGNNAYNLANEEDGFSGAYGREHYYTLVSLFDKLNGNGCGISVNHAKNYDQIAFIG